MKKVTLFFGFLFIISAAISQVGIGTVTPDASSILDLSATDKGVLIPQVSLSDVSDTMLDGVNNAANGLLIYNVNAGVTGGNGVGFYYFNGTSWERLSTAAGDDIDWYKVGTTTAPTTINDSLYTQGNLAIGKTTADYKLDVNELNSAALRTLNIVSSNATTTKSSSIHNEVNYTGTDTLQASYNFITNSGSGATAGTVNEIQGTSTGSHIGSFNRLLGNSFSNKIGTYNEMAAISGARYGIYNDFPNTGGGPVYGLWNNIVHTGFSTPTGIYNSINSNKTSTGVQNYIYNSSTNNESYGVNNNMQGFGGSWIMGVQNVMDNSGNGEHAAILNIMRGTGTGSKYGVYSSISNTANGTHYGVYSLLSSNGSGIKYGTYNDISGSGSGNKYGAYTLIDPAAGGTHYGVYSNVQKVGSYAGYFIGEILGTTRLELTSNIDANGTAGTGVLEIGNNLRIDDNEIITNSGSTLFLQYDNTGDLRVDDTTLMVDADLNRVGVGTITPGFDLNVKQSSLTEGGAGGLGLTHSTNANNWKVYHSGAHLSFAENGVRRAYVTAGSGAYTVTSDKRLKKNIVLSNEVLSKLKDLNTYTYLYKNQANSAKKTLGFMAQDVLPLFPELVETNEEGYLGLNYSGFGVIAIKAIQEQQEIIDGQRVEINELRRKVEELDQLKNDMAEMKTMLSQLVSQNH